MSVIKFAELAINNRDIKYLKEALIYLSKSEKYNDPNDSIVRIAIINHAALKLDLDSSKFLLYNLDSFSKELQLLIKEFVVRDKKDKSIEVMGYKEIQSPIFRFEYIQ